MALSCIHTHTLFCDGAGDVETFCRAAYEKGLGALGFSAHAPIEKKTSFSSSWNMPEERLNEYLDTVRAAKKRWEGKLPVYLGLEVDFIDRLMGPADRDYRKMDLDFIIGSVHYLIPPRGEPFTVDDDTEYVDRGIGEGFGGDSMAMVDMYYNSMAEMIRAGGFDLLGHPDLVRKNNANYRLFQEDNDFYRNKTASITALMAGTGVPGEVNTGGLNRGKMKDCYPSPPFLKLFREHDVPMVINADAHKADDLDGHYEEGRKAMLAAGYTETALFEGRKNGSPQWKSEKL